MTTVEPLRPAAAGVPSILSFDVLATDVSARAVVSAQGELDPYGARQLGDCLLGLVDDGWTEIDLDLAGVSLGHFDGVGALQLVLVQLARAGASVTLGPRRALACRLLTDWRHRS